LLAKAKLNSIEEKFTQAIKEGKSTDKEFNDVEQEIKNYETMKSNILAEYNKGKNLNSDFKFQLIDKGRTLGRYKVWNSPKKYKF
jgi:hypothetical protein